MLRMAEIVKMYYFRGDEKTTSGYLNSIPDLIIYVTKFINRGLLRAYQVPLTEARARWHSKDAFLQTKQMLKVNNRGVNRPTNPFVKYV